MSKAKKKAAEKGQTLVDAGRSKRRTGLKLPTSKASGGALPGIDLNRASDLEDRMNRYFGAGFKRSK